MAEMEKTMIDNDGFGGMSTLAGGAGFVGGLVLGSLWNNNGFGGRWNNGGNCCCGASQAIDTASINASINSVGEQLNNLGMQNMQQTCNTNMNLINAVTNAHNSINNTLNQNNLANTQGFAGVQSALCQGFSGVNSNVTSQGYESRIATNQLASQMASCCCELKQEVQRQGCLDRELQRQIHTENIQSQLCDAKAKIASLEAQNAFTASQNAQTAYLLSQLKTTATA